MKKELKSKEIEIKKMMKQNKSTVKINKRFEIVGDELRNTSHLYNHFEKQDKKVRRQRKVRITKKVLKTVINKNKETATQILANLGL